MIQYILHCFKVLQGEVGSLFPSWFRTLFLGTPASRQLLFSANASDIQLKRSKVLVPLDLARRAVVELKPTQRAIVDPVLPEGMLLKRTIRLPSVAARNIEDAARLDLVRGTPFQENDVVWVMSPTRRDGSEVVATQWVAKRDDLLQLEERLRALGFIPFAFQIEGHPELSKLPVQSTGASGTSKYWGLLNASLLLLAFAITGWIWLAPTLAETRNLAIIEQQVDGLRQEAVELRREVEALRARDTERSAFLNEIVQRPRLIDALRDLTVVIPDDTWVTHLSFSSENVTISGQTTSSAAGMVLSLTNGREFQNPRLTGPVSRAQSGAEAFEISVGLGGS